MKVRLRVLIWSLALLLISELVHGQTTPVGTETKINGTTAGDQRAVAVSTHSDNRYAVVWESEDQDGDGGTIVLSAYNADGSTFIADQIVNTTTAGSQSFPDVTFSENGNIIVTWMGPDADGWGVFMSAFDGTGSRVIAETAVNSTTVGNQRFPKVASNHSGGFVITWENAANIVGQRFTNLGVADGAEFVINATNKGNQLYPDVAMDRSGDFVVIWQSDSAGGNFDIHGQLYNSVGTNVGNAFLVNQTQTDHQQSPAVSMDSTGAFVVVWESNLQDGEASGIYGRRFSNTAVPLADEFLVNTTTTGPQASPAVTMSFHGIFMASWTSFGQDGDQGGIYYQLFKKDGEKAGTELKANTRTADYQILSNLSLSLDEGVATVAWQDGRHASLTTHDGDQYGIYSQRFQIGDVTNPVAIGMNLNVYLDGNGNATVNGADYDNGSTDANGVTFSISKSAWTCTDLGENDVVFTVEDPTGNQASLNLKATVLDTISPSMNVQNINLYLDASGNASIVAADLDNGTTDNCQLSTLTIDKSSFACADTGANNITVTGTDASGNVATKMAVVTVLDTISPVAAAQNLTLYLDASGNGSIVAADVDNGSSDVCGVASLALSKTAFTCSDLGANNVNLTVTDNSGNTGMAPAVITVLDTISPAISAQNINLYLDASGNGTITSGDLDNGSTDNCGISSLVASKTTFNCSDLGANQVTLTATDASGNAMTTAVTATALDTISPVVVTQNLTLALDGAGSVSITAADIDNGSSDNCTVASLSIDRDTFTSADIGANTVTLTVTDGSGNSKTSTANVTVQKGEQSITFGSLANSTYGDADFNLTATASSGLAVTYNSSNSAVATILGNTVTILGVGTTSITASQAGDANFNAAPDVIQTLTVVPATLTVTADNQSKTYGDANPTFTVSYAGFVNGESEGVLTTLPTATSATDASSNVGTYAIIASGGVDENYSFSYVDGTLTIGQATLTVTADDQSKTYGDVNPAFTVTYAGFLNGDTESVLDTAPTANSSADATSSVGTYAITASGGSDNNYALSYVNGTLTIGQAILTVTADNQSKTYGDANPAFTITYAGFLNGDTESVLDTAPTANSTTDATSAVGTYTITASGGSDNNYTFSYVDGTLTIGQATLTVSADDQSKTYGDANPAFTVSYSGFLNGDTESVLDTAPTATSTADATSAVGTYAISASGGSDNNYTFNYVHGTLTIGQAILAVTADDQNKTYGDANPTFTVTYAGFLNGDSESVLDTAPTANSTADGTSAVGTYAITASGGSDNNYAFSYVDGTLTIGKATLTVTADDQSKTYGDANPTFTVTYAGFLNGDTESVLDTAPTANSTADATSAVGTYEIIASGGSDNNYAFSYIDGMLTIGQATLTVTADDQSKTYGDVNPIFTVTYTGFLNGDTEGVLDTAPTANSTADATSAVGTYAITASGGSDNNYAFSYVDGTLTIGQATLTVTADDQSKTYGDANPIFTLTYLGFLNGDTESVLDTAPSANSSTDATSAVGTYAITVSGGSDNNYDFSYVDGTLTIGQATLTVTADDQSKTYGDANPAFTVTYTGFLNGDTESVLDTSPTANSTVDATSAAGTYAITATGGSDNNYALSYVDGTLTIGQATLTVTADDQSKTYGDANPTFTVTYAGFLNGDTESVLDTAPEANSTADASSAVGSYAITASGGSDNNYAFSYVDGALTIGQATLTVTADDQSKTYGEANPSFTVIYAGFLNGDTESVLDTTPTANSAADATSAVGTYAITASGGSDNNYAFSYVDGTLTIGQATLTVTADDQNKTYGDANPALTVTYSGFLSGDTESVLDTAPTANSTTNETSAVGTYAITASGGFDSNYAFSYVDGTLTIGQATLTVVADDQSKIYGDDNPTFTLSYSGFVNGDSEAELATIPTGSSTENASSEVGTYPITVSGGADNNYSFVYQEGSLQVTQAPLAISVDGGSSTYGSDPITQATLVYNGFVNGDTEAVLDELPVISTEATATSPVGDYPATIAGGSDNNYAYTLTDGTLAIVAKTLEVTASDASRNYGSPNPDFELSYSGFVNGEDVTDLGVEPVASTVADGSSVVGTYDINVADGEADNYEFTYVTGLLTIEKAPLMVTADDQTRAFGVVNPELTVSYSGYVNGEDESVLDTVPTTSSDATESSAPGTYNIVVSGGLDDNYELSYVEGSLTVTQAEQIITFDSLQVLTFGDPAIDLVASASSGLGVTFTSSDESIAVINETSLSIVGAGTTQIIASQSGDVNYQAAEAVSRTIVIEKADQAITFEALIDRTFGDPDFNLAASASSGLEVAYSSSDSTVAKVQGSLVEILGAGTVTFTAAQTGDNNYNAATSIAQILVVNKADQEIFFEALEDKTLGDPDFELTAESSSALEVIYTSSNTSVATVEGSTVTLVGVGATVITASQEGDNDFYPAVSVAQTLSVGQLNDTRITSSITIEPIADQQIDASEITLMADIRPDTAKVIYEVLSGPATIEGEVLTIGNEAGIVQVRGTIPETSTYKGSEDVIEFAVVDPVLVTPVISFVLPSTALVSNPIPLTATVDAQGASTVTSEDIIFEVVSGPGVIIGNFLGFSGTGIVTLSASLPATSETNAVVSQSSVEVVALYQVSGAISDEQGAVFSDGFVVISDLNDVTNSHSTSINADGSYAFADLPSGDYELFVTPFDVNFVLTFFGDVSPVLDPEVTIPALNIDSDLTGVNVVMQTPPPPAVDILSEDEGGTINFQAQNVENGGNRFVQGRVEMGEPLPNTLVILKTINDEYVDAEVTDDLGLIEFKGLPTADYKLVLDIPGVGEISATVGVQEGGMVEVTALIDDKGAQLEVDQVLSTVPRLELEVQVYPNPVTDFIRLEFPTAAISFERSIMLFDLEGRLIKSTESDKKELIIDTVDLKAGVFLLQVQEGEKTIRKRILKLK